MNRASKILIVIVVTFAIGAVHAQTVNWNYVQAGWESVDPDEGSSENGWLLGGAFEFGKNVRFHVFGEFADLGPLDQWQIGAGWHGLLGKRADLFADGAFYDVDLEDGYRIRFGARWMVLKRLELNGFLAWTDLDLTDNRSVAANAIFDFSKRFGVGGGLDWGSDFTIARAFVRFNFGPRG